MENWKYILGERFYQVSDLGNVKSIGNLSWGTQHENMADRIVHGTYQYGEKGPANKLTERQVKEILASSDHRIDLAQKYGVNERTIRHIRDRTTWAYLSL